MTPAVIWLIAGIILVVAEVLSGDFVLLMLGGAALVAGGASLLGADPVGGVVVFAAAAGVLVFAVRPPLRRRLESGMPRPVLHTQKLIGAPATAVTRVDGRGGQIRIHGELWSARAVDSHEIIEPGAAATVMDISGATALVVGVD